MGYFSGRYTLVTKVCPMCFFIGQRTSLPRWQTFSLKGKSLCTKATVASTVRLSRSKSCCGVKVIDMVWLLARFNWQASDDTEHPSRVKVLIFTPVPPQESHDQQCWITTRNTRANFHIDIMSCCLLWVTECCRKFANCDQIMKKSRNTKVRPQDRPRVIPHFPLNFQFCSSIAHVCCMRFARACARD